MLSRMHEFFVIDNLLQYSFKNKKLKKFLKPGCRWKMEHALECSSDNAM